MHRYRCGRFWLGIAWAVLLLGTSFSFTWGAAPAIAQSTAPGVSFTRQVAPLLVAKCGNCHIRRSRGELNMSTYVSLGKGSKNGTVIRPGDAPGSRIVEVLESGDMPRAGGKLSPEELALVSKWIAAGAKFDGPDSAAPLSSFSPAKKEDPPAKLAVVAAAPQDAVQFARDVGPVLLAQCTECHGEQNPRNNLSMQTFNSLLRGGDSGAVLAPKKPEESLLVKKLRGAAGARMPKDRPPLPEETIAKIETWILLGAKFDGLDAEAALEDTVAQSLAQHATHDELSRRRIEVAARNWRLILPDAPAHYEETPQVLVYGSATAEILADVARVADDQAAKLRKLFKTPNDQPLVKGRLTIFVFDKRYDYGEVGTMLEHREIPAAWRGHWHYSPLDAYGCVLLSSDAKASPGLVAQQIAGAYVAGLGKIPRWFAEGTARAVSAKVEPKDPRVKTWDEQVPRILKAHEKPDGFLSDSLPPEESDVLSYSFVKSLMTSGNRHAALMAALQQGTAFDPAFAKVYGGPPSQLVPHWSVRAAKRGR